MEAKIVKIFNETDCPRYAFGLLPDYNYIVLSPVNAGDNSLAFKENDILEIRTISPGPVSAFNKTAGKNIAVGVCEIGISKDGIKFLRVIPRLCRGTHIV